jgi:hypothetical protein
MKRNLELVEPLPAKVEDCFAEFDKVFDSLATQLEWQDAEPAARVESITRVEPAPAPSAQIALVQSKPMPAPPAPPAPETAADVLQQYERAFSVLDDKLAESDGIEVTKLTELTERPKRYLPSDRLAATRTAQRTQEKTKRVRRANRTFDDVFGVLENLSIVRRRGRLSDERLVIARLLADARQLCADLALHSAGVRVEFAVLTLENDHFDKLGTEIDELARHIRHDLRFCSIAPGKQAVSRK